MKHRLTSAIVVRSSVLLTGALPNLACGGAVQQTPVEAGANAVVVPAPATDANAAPGASVPPPEDSGAPDARDARDAAYDAAHDAASAMCERGWPTTKGQVCKLEDGLLCCERPNSNEPRRCCPEQGR